MTMQTTTKIPAGIRKAEIAEARESLNDIFTLSERPIIGKRCVGLFRVDEFQSEFDQYLLI